MGSAAVTVPISFQTAIFLLAILKTGAAKVPASIILPMALSSMASGGTANLRMR